jgi:hypothetical protein
MTTETIENTINNRRLPKDELDRFWDNLLGFFPATLLLIAGLGPIISPKTTMTANSIFIVLTIGIVVFVYTIYAKLTERNLKVIKTGLDRNENETLIKIISEKENWARQTNRDYFHSFNIPFVWFHYGFKLTLIPIDNGILINFRNRGTVQARMPYQLGIETIKQRTIEKKIINYAQQHLQEIGGSVVK